MTRTHWLLIAAILVALALPTGFRMYEHAQQWTNQAGDRAACAYGQQADAAAGREPRTCK